MYRFFVEKEQIAEHEIRITGTDVNHIRNVLRMRIGEEIYISDQDKMEYTCQIKDFEEEAVVAEILFGKEVGYELSSQIYLFQGLPKGDKMELIVQKAVELGAFQVIPVEMKRCVVKLDAKRGSKKVARWQAISESAAKQAKRMVIPEVHEILSFKDALQLADTMDVRLLPYELAKDMEATRKALSAIRPGQSIGIFIGPEGGFAQEEVEEALRHDITPITLGKRILRTETAGMTVLSILMYLLEP